MAKNKHNLTSSLNLTLFQTGNWQNRVANVFFSVAGTGGTFLNLPSSLTANEPNGQCDTFATAGNRGPTQVDFDGNNQWSSSTGNAGFGMFFKNDAIQPSGTPVLLSCNDVPNDRRPSCAEGGPGPCPSCVEGNFWQPLVQFAQTPDFASNIEGSLTSSDQEQIPFSFTCGPGAVVPTTQTTTTQTTQTTQPGTDATVSTTEATTPTTEATTPTTQATTPTTQATTPTTEATTPTTQATTPTTQPLTTSTTEGPVATTTTTCELKTETFAPTSAPVEACQTQLLGTCNHELSLACCDASMRCARFAASPDCEMLRESTWKCI